MVVGPLGSFTIVGSASFNLFVISAVCTAGMPKGETRLINPSPDPHPHPHPNPDPDPDPNPNPNPNP